MGDQACDAEPGRDLDRVDTLRTGGAWVVRAGTTVTRFPSRAAAVEAGWRLAVETGRDHVVHYAST
jgi:hypothetical protein